MKIGISRQNDGQAAGRKKLKYAIPAKAGILAVAVFADEKKHFRLAPDICRGRNKFGGVYSALQFLSFAKNAGFCSSKLLRLISPPTNVGGEKLFYGQRGRKNKYSSFLAKNPVIPAFAAEFREKTLSFPRKRESIRGD